MLSFSCSSSVRGTSTAADADQRLHEPPRSPSGRAMGRVPWCGLALGCVGPRPVARGMPSVALVVRDVVASVWAAQPTVCVGLERQGRSPMRRR